MDDDDAAPDSDHPPPSSSFTLIIRWWHESGARGQSEKDRALRGTVRDLMGRTLGSFAGIEALFHLLRRIMGDRPRPPH
ncbi:MAG TPA: hypothetical protein VGW40_07850 [Allosphingosinicella sp.]|nr:hypothetical protein [Allosphingosinicella sp.]